MNAVLKKKKKKRLQKASGETKYYFGQFTFFWILEPVLKSICWHKFWFSVMLVEQALQK